jgi:capsular exopolysaccharide synthesis family protein
VPESEVSDVPDTVPHRHAASYEPLHLRDYWHVVRRRRGIALAVFLLVTGAGAAWVRLVRPVYQAKAQILIERDAPDLLDFDRNPRVHEAWEDFFQTQYRLLQSRLLARKVIERLGLLQDPEFLGPRPAEVVEELQAAAPGTSPVLEQAIDTFLSRLKVQPLKNSQLVTIGFTSHRPELAAEAANALAQVFIEQTLEFRYRVSAEAGAWLDKETMEQTRQLESSERALQKFKEKEGLTNIEERRTLIEQKLKDLGGSLTAAKTRRLEKEALHRQMRSAANPEELPEVIRSPLIQSLRTELAALERQNAQLSDRYLDRHPQVVKLQQQIDATRDKIGIEARRIVRAAENDYEVALANERSVAGALEAAKAEALELSHRTLKYDALKRDLEASQRLSEGLLARQKQADVARSVQASNVHIIDPAVVPRSPARPRPARDLALSFGLGLACALGAAFLRDYLDGSVGRPQDLRLLGVPLLGVIPEARQRGGPPIASNGRGQGPFAEGYRLLRTAVGQVPAHGGGQVLVVTSTLPGEGKTLTSINLALTLASTDARVLLVDADLRRPALHAFLRARRVPGLSELLARMVRPEQAIQRVPGVRLCLLPAGTPLQRSPADLLATAAMRELIATLRDRFDQIVLDTPPIGAVADALVVSPLADAVLVVAQAGRVGRGALAQVLGRLSLAQSRVAGVVLNRARPQRHAYDYGPSFAPEALAPRRGPDPDVGTPPTGRAH